MRLPSSSNLALLALSPSLLSSPVFGAPTPDVGGGLSPNPNTGYFADSPQPQTTDSPLLQGTPVFSVTPTFTAGATPPTAKVAGRRRSIKHQNSVKFRAIALNSVDPEVIPAPDMASPLTAVAPVLISPGGSVHISLPLVADAPENEDDGLKVQDGVLGTAEYRWPQHDSSDIHLESQFLKSPIPHDAPMFPPPAAIAKRDVVGSILPSTPSTSYVSALDGSNLLQGLAPVIGSGASYRGVVDSIQGLGLNDTPLENIPQTLKQGLSSTLGAVDPVMGVISNPNELSSLVGRVPIVAPSLAGLGPIPSVSGIGETLGEGMKSVGGVSSLPLGMSPPLSGLPNLAGAGLSNLPGAGLLNVPNAGLPIPLTGVPSVPYAVVPGLSRVNPLPISTPIQATEPLKAIPDVLPVANGAGALPISLPAPISAAAPILGAVTSGADLSGLPRVSVPNLPVAIPNAGLPIVPGTGLSSVPGLNTLPIPVQNVAPVQVTEPLKVVSGIVPGWSNAQPGSAPAGLSKTGTLPVPGAGSLSTPISGAGILPVPIPDANSAPIPSLGLPSVLPGASNVMPEGVDVPVVSGATSVLPSLTGAIPTGMLDVTSSLGPLPSSSLLAVATTVPNVKAPAYILPSEHRQTQDENEGKVEAEAYKTNGGMGTMGRPEEMRVKDFGDWVVDDESTSAGPSSTVKFSESSSTVSSSHSNTHSLNPPTSTTSSASSGTETATKTEHSTRIAEQATPTPVAQSSELERRSMIPVEILPTLATISVPPAHASLSPVVSPNSSSDDGGVVASVISSIQPTPVYLGGSPLSRVPERNANDEPLTTLMATRSLRWGVGLPRMTTLVVKSAATGAASANGQTN